MFCSHCGNNVQDGLVQCPYCQQSLLNPNLPNKRINSHMAAAILVTIFCCIPFGIVAIVFAAKVSSLVAAGRFDEAIQASRNAKKWALIGMLTGLIGYPLYFFMQIVAAITME